MTLSNLSWSSSASTAPSKSSRFWPCQTSTFTVPGLLDRWISSFHWLRSDVGATISVAHGPCLDLGRCRARGRNALSNLSWRCLLESFAAVFGSISSVSRWVWQCIRDEIMMVLPIPTVCQSDQRSNEMRSAYFLSDTHPKASKISHAHSIVWCESIYHHYCMVKIRFSKDGIQFDVRKDTSFTFPLSFRKLQTQLSRVWIEIELLIFGCQIDDAIDWLRREGISVNQIHKGDKKPVRSELTRTRGDASR